MRAGRRQPPEGVRHRDPPGLTSPGSLTDFPEPSQVRPSDAPPRRVNCGAVGGRSGPPVHVPRDDENPTVADDSKPDPSEVHDVFDVRRVRRLVALMNEHDLTEIDLRQGNQRVRLRRGADQPVFAATPAYSPPAPRRPRQLRRPPPLLRRPLRQARRSRAPWSARSTCRRAPSGRLRQDRRPGRPRDDVCIIEAMKVFNEIPAEASGKITAVLVENGEPVEFGQPLFRIE